METDRKAELIEEYKVTSVRIDQANNFIWRTALIPLSIVATSFGAFLSFLVRTELRLETGWLLILGGTVSSVLSLRWWNNISDRWNDYISSWCSRLHEIEQDLIFFANRNIPGTKPNFGVKALRHKLESYVAGGWVSIWFFYLILGMQRCFQAGCEIDDAQLLPAIASAGFVILMLILAKRRPRRGLEDTSAVPEPLNSNPIDSEPT